MKKKTEQSTGKVIVFILCIVLFFILQIITVTNNSTNVAYNGVLMACQYAICLIMVQQDDKRGAITSLVLMSLSLLSMVRVLIFMKMTSVLPGICNSLIYIGSLLMLTRQFTIREKEALTDSLTGLRNRRGIYLYLSKRVKKRKKFHLIYVDLKNFKFINDQYGHSYGDTVLKDVSDRIAAAVGRDGTVARMGGDEFVVALNKSVNPEEIAQGIVNNIKKKLELVVNGDIVECFLEAYAGVATYPTDTVNYEELLKYADIAMYHATNEEGVNVKSFDKDMQAYLTRKLEVETLIKAGLEKDLFYMVYQPQYKIDGKQLRGFESLIRLKDAEGNMVSPGEFIPVAEQDDLILYIDDYVMDRVMQEFRDVIKDRPELTISVNVSAKNIASPEFADRVKYFLNKNEFPGGNLEIEITEYCLVQSISVTIENITKLREMGVQVALDDFGTGYTSLSYLAKMPINLLKVDKSLVDDIENDNKSLNFVNTVIQMGHLMGCEVISEGVETEGQLKHLKDKECDFVQGYVWGRPLAYEDALILCK